MVPRTSARNHDRRVYLRIILCWPLLMVHIASVYYDMGEYTKSLSFHEQALEMRKKSLPANHPLLATSYGNIASVYSEMGEYTKSLSFHNQALEIMKKSLPANHPHLATSYGNIASVYSEMGEYTKSLSFHEQALEIRKKSLPANHPSLATSYGNIAAVYYTKSISRTSAHHGHFLRNITSVYSHMGEYTISRIPRTSARNHEEESTCQSSFARHFLW